jgi:MoaA/NifB/PqqE/SkfB family radical SAM enzyme
MPADDDPSIVHFGWDLTYACNYDCPYCRLPAITKPRPVAEWVKVWERLHKRYGRCYIYMSGGEPSIWPGFYDLVKALTPMHTIDLCTNLSWKVEKLVPDVDPKHFRISPTFHPTQVPFEEFLPRAVYAKDYLPMRFPPKKSVYFVMYPKQLDRLEEYKAKLDENGLVLIPLPLVGLDKEFANDEREKKVVEDISPNKDTWDKKLDYQLKNETPQGKLCHAGQRYAHIRADGMVDRCTRHEDRQLGSIFDENFEMFPEPKVCRQEWCPFESQWLVRDKAAVGAKA